MKSKLLATILALVMVLSCMFTLTACGGFSDFIDKIFDKDDKQVQTDDTNNDNDDNDDDDDDETPVVYSFATDSWATIAEVSASGNASEVYAVGDEKTFSLSTGEVVAVVIYGFNHDDLADGSGKAGITIGLKDVLETQYKMTNQYESGSWADSLLRLETMPLIFAQLPTELQSIIKTVTKTSVTAYPSSYSATSEDKLFLFSAREVYDLEANGEMAGTQYEYWRTIKDGTSLEDRIKSIAGVPVAWHLRSYYRMPSVFYIGSDGKIVDTSEYIANRGVCFGFCV